jgi:hypothetical protein
MPTTTISGASAQPVARSAGLAIHIVLGFGFAVFDFVGVDGDDNKPRHRDRSRSHRTLECQRPDTRFDLNVGDHLGKIMLKLGFFFLILSFAFVERPLTDYIFICLQVPIFLSEISPPSFRATYPGVAYQIGNMVSSASAQIEATGGDHLRTTAPNGEPVPDYAKVQGILIGCVAAFLITVTLFGPEHHGSHFEQHKAAFEEGAAEDDDIVGVHPTRHHHDDIERSEKASEERIDEKQA